jgi:hypothetical protein
MRDDMMNHVKRLRETELARLLAPLPLNDHGLTILAGEIELAQGAGGGVNHESECLGVGSV